MLEGEALRDRFEQLYLHYRRMMFYTAMRILHDEPDAEDAVHQAFLSILENFERIADLEDPKTQAYILVTTERKAIDIVREGKRFVEAEMDQLGAEYEPPGISDLSAAMERLPARYRRVMLLRYQDGYTVKELADMLGMKRGTVDKLLWRAKLRLKQLLDEEEARSVK